jgi:hypothetical protein
VITSPSAGHRLIIPSSPIKFETLEGRLLLHGTLAELIELGVPQSMINDSGHIAYDDFMTLTDAQRAHIDPHLVEADIPDGPINFDEILGIPLSATGRGNPEADVFPDWYPAINGSITLDQTSQSGRTLVKFPTAINNQGTGPGIGISGRPGVDPIPTGAPITSWLRPDGGQVVLQPIYNWTGSSFALSSYRDAGSFTYHAGHGHFHFDGYNNYRLRQNNGGTPGPYVNRPDGTAIIGEKVGFCLINVLSSFTMENGQSSTTLQGYNAPGQPGTGCGFVQGVHVGKADQYGSGTSGQWLDVTGVPNGQYYLEITVDGENVMQETNETNNTKLFPFNLNVNPPAGGIPRDEFDTPGNNDTLANAADMGTMGVFTKTGLTIHWGQDYDFFKFVASSSGNYTVSTTQASGDVNLFLYDANQNLIGSSTNSSGTDSITRAFVEGQTYYAQARTYNSGVSSNYQIAWNLLPLASSTSPAPVAMEGGPIGRFRIARNGPLEQPLTVNFTIGGTAQNGVDYQTIPASITMGNLDAFVDIDIVPFDDTLVEGRETITLTITSGAAYVVGPTGSVVAIADNDLPRSRFTPSTVTDAVPAPSSGLFSDRRLGQDLEDDAVRTLLA